MRATLRIKWLTVLLGFLCHSVYADTTAETATGTPADVTSVAATDGDEPTKTTATTVSAATATAGVTTSQNNTDKQSTAVQTTQTIPTQSTATLKAETTGTSPTAALTSPTKEATTAITTLTLAATPTPAPSETVTSPSTQSVLSTKPSTVTASTYSLSSKITAPYVSSANEDQRKSTNSPTVPTSSAPALTTVAAAQTLPTVSTEIPESTIVPGEARANTQLTNPGDSSTSSITSSITSSSTSSSTSSITSSITSSSTSFSVKKGVNTATTDSAMQATTATIKTPTSTQKFVYFHKGNEEKEQIKTDNKTLIAILASCGALLIMIVILGACASHHRKPYNENQQHLTEELHTVENGYHDNPTLEVMEVQPEMLEKKMVLNGEFNDSWMVPLDHLSKEDHPEEEDTHL
uniref:Podocalyxin n=1 Tax=Astatotilapia calliptera TaxID=8154 RepID=A0AAX7V6W4_ASTCA